MPNFSALITCCERVSGGRELAIWEGYRENRRAAIGLAVLSFPLASYVLVVGSLLFAQIAGAALAALVSIENYRESEIVWDGLKELEAHNVLKIETKETKGRPSQPVSYC